MAQGAIVARIVSEYSAKGTKAAQKDLNRLNKKFDEMGKRALLATNAAIAGFAALSVKVGKDAVRAAIDDSKSQALLAGTLQNVTGASTDQVKAVEAQIAALSAATGVLDDDLRPSLQQFLMLTKDIEKAQFLQGIAVELAANKQIDLASATNIITKAYNGQFRGLTALGIALDDNIIKNKDVAGALEATMKATEGSSAAANKADPFIKLNRDIQELYETLGTALLPVMVEFVNYLRDVLIPQLTDWVTLNKEQLGKSLQEIADWAMKALNAAIAFDKGLRSMNMSLVGVIENLGQIVALANLGFLFAGGKMLITDLTKVKGATMGAAQGAKGLGGYAAKLSQYLGGVGTATAATTGKFAALKASFVRVTSGASGGSKALRFLISAFKLFFKLGITSKLLLIFAAFKGISWIIGKVKDAIGGTDDVVKKKIIIPTQNAHQATIDYFNEWTKRTIKQKKDAETLAQIEKDRAAQAKRDAQDARTAAIKAAIAKKFNVKLTDPDQKDEIDARAIQLNLIRSKKIAEAELIKQGEILKALNKAALEEEIKLRERLKNILEQYRDDQKVDIVEIGILAKLWGVTTEAAALYVDQVLAVADNKISADEVTNLSLQWGISKEQAGKYLDFLKAVSDGKISDSEIKNLASKWNMTITEAQKYADFIIAVQDRDLNDAEVQRLKDKWKLTNDELTAYIIGIGAPVKYQGSILDPGSIKKLEDAWTAALAALIKYKNALGQGGFTAITPTNPSTSSSSSSSSSSSASSSTASTASRTDSAAEVASKAAAAAYAAALAAGDTAKAAIAAVGVRPSDLALAESGAIGAASMARQMAEAEKALALQQNITAMSNFRAKEAEDLAASLANSRTMDYDERFRFRNSLSGTMDNAKGLMAGGLPSSGGNTTVNLTVNGTVTSEQDLISTIRQGLLLGQTNGQTLTLAAI